MANTYYIVNSDNTLQPAFLKHSDHSENPSAHTQPAPRRHRPTPAARNLRRWTRRTVGATNWAHVYGQVLMRFVFNGSNTRTLGRKRVEGGGRGRCGCVVDVWWVVTLQGTVVACRYTTILQSIVTVGTGAMPKMTSHPCWGGVGVSALLM